MKYLVLLALVAVASSASFINRPTVVANDFAEIQQIIDAIYSPSTDPATAVALQAMLYELLGIPAPKPEAIGGGPALVDEYEPIAVGPTIIDDSIVTEIEAAPIAPAPVVPIPIVPETGSPLVQIIVNVNQASAGVVDMPALESPAHLPEFVEEVQDDNPIDVIAIGPQPGYNPADIMHPVPVPITT